MKMKAKFLTLILLTAITLTVLVSALNVDVSTPAKLTKSTDTTSFTVKNNDATGVNVAVTLPASITDGTDSVTITSPSTLSFTLASGASSTISVVRGDVPSGFDLGEFSSSIQVGLVNASDATITDSKTVALSFVNSFCSDGPLNISDLDLNVDINNLGQGEDDNWLPLDEVKVEVELDNSKSLDLDTVYFELAFIEKDSGKNVADDLIWLSKDEEKVKIGDIDEDESETFTFQFKVGPELGIKDKDYLLMVKAYPKDSEDEICIDSSDDLSNKYFEDITVDRENEDDRLVVLDNIVLPSEATCQQTVQLTADMYNIGDDDEEQTRVRLYNKELGLDLNQVIRENLDAGDKDNVEFTFDVPKDAAEKTYTLELRTFYSYDEDDDTYDDNSKPFFAYLKVSGNCVSSVQEQSLASITAELGSDAVAGKQLVIEGTLKNIGTQTTIYTLAVSGITSWATLNEISPSTLTLEAGKSADFTIYLNVDDDVEGEQSLSIKATHDTKTTEQDVIVEIQGKTSGFLTGSAIGEHLRNNWFIWVIVLINVILIIAIIVVARRIVAAR